MRLSAAFAISVPLLLAQTEHAPVRVVTAVRHWSLAEVTRVAVEVSGDFEFHGDRLHNPERIYFDILNAHPRIDGRRGYSEDLGDRLVERIRVAETTPGVTRVVLDLSAAVEATTSKLVNPYRLIIELRKGPDTGGASSAPPAMITQPEIPKTAPVVPLKPPSAPPVKVNAERAAAEPAKTPPARRDIPAALPEPPVVLPPAPAASAEAKAATKSPATEDEVAQAARHPSSGQNSLIRALGLKINRVVIDPGHGGHDDGTKGPKGLLEKDLVLDVAKRVGKLIEDRMGAEVIYTRSDDTFVPLEGRTALANEKKADLFLSIHANSSSLIKIAGVETYYLNFTQAKDALDVAARENASSQKSIFELQDIIQKITLQDKAAESREFASRVQAALYAFSARSFPAAKNRGVKKAPFVVLIGANMPSVLAEIGFLSNAREEALLMKPDYRQKLAEALFRGVEKYAAGLSHFQIAQGSVRAGGGPSSAGSTR